MIPSESKHAAQSQYILIIIYKKNNNKIQATNCILDVEGR